MSAVLSTRVVIHESDRDQAREEIRDDIIGGKTRGGFDLRSILDCELNGDGYEKTVTELAGIMGRLYGDNHSAAATWLDVVALTERIVTEHLPEQLIEDRAYDIADARREEALRGF